LRSERHAAAGTPKAACRVFGMAVDHVVYGGVLDWGGIEKFAWPRTFRRWFRGFSKKERSGPSGIGDKPFGDRVFRSLTRALAL